MIITPKLNLREIIFLGIISVQMELIYFNESYKN